MDDPRLLLYSALEAPVGIVCKTDDVQKAIQRLQSERRKAGDPALQALVIAVSRTNPESEVWIAKKEQSVAEEK